MFETFANIPLQKRWRQQTHPMPVVVAIIRRETRNKETGALERSYLLIRRNSEPYSQRWALVGGKWDFGETLVAASKREVKEETGLDTNFVALRGLVSERVSHRENHDGGAAHFLLFVCQLEASSGIAREQREGAVAWFSAEEIDELEAARTIIPSDFEMLRRFIDAGSLNHYEVEMLTGTASEQLAGVDELMRFQQIK